MYDFESRTRTRGVDVTRNCFHSIQPPSNFLVHCSDGLVGVFLFQHISVTETTDIFGQMDDLLNDIALNTVFLHSSACGRLDLVCSVYMCVLGPMMAYLRDMNNPGAGAAKQATMTKSARAGPLTFGEADVMQYLRLADTAALRSGTACQMLRRRTAVASCKCKEGRQEQAHGPRVSDRRVRVCSFCVMGVLTAAAERSAHMKVGSRRSSTSTLHQASGDACELSAASIRAARKSSCCPPSGASSSAESTHSSRAAGETSTTRLR